MSAPTTYRANIRRIIDPPRLPKQCPVVILRLHAPTCGNGYAIVDTAGQLVEFIAESEGRVWARWPWAHHTVARRLGIVAAYGPMIDVPAKEWKRWRKLGEEAAQSKHENAETVKLRKLADRCERWSAVRSALVDIRQHQENADYRTMLAALEGRVNGHAESDARGATVYHRLPGQGGNQAEAYLNRAMRAFVRAGMVERIDTPPTVADLLAQAKERGEGLTRDAARRRAAFFRHAVGHYRPTDTTPDLY